MVINSIGESRRNTPRQRKGVEVLWVLHTINKTHLTNKEQNSKRCTMESLRGKYLVRSAVTQLVGVLYSPRIDCQKTRRARGCGQPNSFEECGEFPLSVTQLV